MKSNQNKRHRSLLNPFRYRVNHAANSDEKSEIAQGDYGEACVRGEKVNEVEIEIKVHKATENSSSDYIKVDRQEMPASLHGVKFYLSVFRPKSKEKDKDTSDICEKDYLGVKAASILDATVKDDSNASTKNSLNSISTQSHTSIKIRKKTITSSSRPVTIQEIIPEKINKTFNSILLRSTDKSITEVSKKPTNSKKHEIKRVTILNPKSSPQVQTQRPSKTPEKPLQDYKIFLKKGMQIVSSKRRCLVQGDLYRSYQSIINYAP